MALPGSCDSQLEQQPEAHGVLALHEAPKGSVSRARRAAASAGRALAAKSSAAAASKKAWRRAIYSRRDEGRYGGALPDCSVSFPFVCRVPVLLPLL